jgi:hypothetical protein
MNMLTQYKWKEEFKCELLGGRRAAWMHRGINEWMKEQPEREEEKKERKKENTKE